VAQIDNFTLPSISADSLWAIAPESLMVVLASALLIIDLFLKKEQKHLLGYIALAGLALIAIVNVAVYHGAPISAFSGMFVLDGFALFFKIITYIVTAFAILLSINYLNKEGVRFGEYYAMLIFAAFGMLIMASAKDLIMVYLGIEAMALSIYVLVGIKRTSPIAIEAAIKYFVMGVLASGVLLYGISLLYLATGTTSLAGIAAAVNTIVAGGGFSALFIAGVVMVIAALGFKVAAAPFHMWAPDAYTGALTSVTAFMSTGAKAAGFAVLVRVMIDGFGLNQALVHEWQPLLIGLAILTMFAGNVAALAQTNIKRMLAYSSVAHAGYALIAVAAGTQAAVSSIMFYMFAYSFMTIGALAVVIMLRKENLIGDNIEDLSGLFKKSPAIAIMMAIFMFSLMGLPPFAGFFAKLFIFTAAIQAGLAWVALVAIIFSGVSAYYYLRIVYNMFMKDATVDNTPSKEWNLTSVVAISAIVTVVLGLLPNWLLSLITNSMVGF
jgi:NADH-quinone oxidoreductase subunit N